MNIVMPMAHMSQLKFLVDESMDPKTPIRQRKVNFNRVKSVLRALKIIPTGFDVKQIGMAIDEAGQQFLVAEVAAPGTVQIPVLGRPQAE